MKKIKLVVFDLDGTLMNAYPAVYRSVNYTVDKFGFAPIAHSTIKRTVGWGDRHLLQSFLGDKIGDKDIDRALSVYRQHHALALRKDTKLLPGALKILQYLQAQGLRIAVASNRPTKFSLIAIRYLKINIFFDYVLCGDKVARPKPAADILKAILKKFKLKPSQALYVGDMGIDVLTGRRARVKTVAVATGSSTIAELTALKPLAVVENVYQVRKFLL
ncbi:MAG: HAD family hydrolase [Candidatus Omnitrophica bacterium]|nr:HAD family hydrolase [Candidatus Omnitrophota bacterium]